jgi:hypothetical protein
VSLRPRFHHLWLPVCLLTAVSSVSGCPVRPDSTETEGREISYGLEIGLTDKYIWKGILYNEGFIAQPEFWISHRGLTAGVWGNATLRDVRRWIRRNEVDYYLTLGYSWWILDIENSLCAYQYPHQSDSPVTGEFVLSLGFPAGPARFVSCQTVDVARYRWAYFAECGIELEIPLTRSIGLFSSLTVGWASRKFNETYSGLPKATASLIAGQFSLIGRPFRGFHADPFLQWNRILDARLKRILRRNPLGFGLLVGMEFGS